MMVSTERGSIHYDFECKRCKLAWRVIWLSGVHPIKKLGINFQVCPFCGLRLVDDYTVIGEKDNDHR